MDSQLRKAGYNVLIGGLADKIKTKDFSPKALKQGRKVEHEHTSSPRIATEIAKDHLTEDPMYYDKLKLIEKKAFADELMKISMSFKGFSEVAQNYAGTLKAAGGIKKAKKLQAAAGGVSNIVPRVGG
jgi:hypothetical protein